MLEYGRDRQAGMSFLEAGDYRLELLSGALNWIRLVEHWRPGVSEGPVPCHHDLQRCAAAGGFLGREFHGFEGRWRSINSDDHFVS
jgi:hypothetical protein